MARPGRVSFRANVGGNRPNVTAKKRKSVQARFGSARLGRDKGVHVQQHVAREPRTLERWHHPTEVAVGLPRVMAARGAAAVAVVAGRVVVALGPDALHPHNVRDDKAVAKPLVLYKAAESGVGPEVCVFHTKIAPKESVSAHVSRL